MEPSTNPIAIRELRGPLILSASIVVVTIGIGLAGGLFGLLAFSALAAIVARRAQLWLLARGTPGWAAILITTGGYILILVVMAVAVVASVAAVGFGLTEDSGQVESWIQTAQDAWGSITGVPPGTLPPIDPTAALGVARSVVSALAPAVTALAMSVLIVIYVLLGARGLHDRMLRATSADVIERYDILATELVTYVKVRALLGAAAALADTVLLLVLGVPYAVLWGLMSFLFSFIPNIGFILAMIPPTVFALIEHGPLSALAVVVGYVLINLAFDYVLQPRVMSTTLEVSPVITIVTILVWTALIGPAGALLAVPLTITLRALLLPFPGTAWFVAFLGRETSVPVDDPPIPDSPVGPPVAPTIEA
ncbi:MAG TPA: AI-2E family transporter [Candidatus Limnocylindrales bacterium]|jgi:predicted PurR-regulated permease PerM